MSADIHIRPAREADLVRINEIYNHYVINTPVTFDLEPITLEQRSVWFERYDVAGKHRLFVAEGEGTVLAYADSHQFRAKRAYDTTVESSAYCDPTAIGRGIGTALYSALFDALPAEEIRVVIAGITLPNDASVALHEKFGFEPAGVMREVGRKFDRFWDVAWFQKPLS